MGEYSSVNNTGTLSPREIIMSSKMDIKKRFKRWASGGSGVNVVDIKKDNLAKLDMRKLDIRYPDITLFYTVCIFLFDSSPIKTEVFQSSI